MRKVRAPVLTDGHPTTSLKTEEGLGLHVWWICTRKYLTSALFWTQPGSSLPSVPSQPYSKAHRSSPLSFLSQPVFTLLNETFRQLALQTFQPHADFFPTLQPRSFLSSLLLSLFHQEQELAMTGSFLRFRFRGPL